VHVAEQREREAVLLREGRVDERVVAADGQQRRPALPHGGRGLIQAGELGVSDAAEVVAVKLIFRREAPGLFSSSQRQIAIGSG
jgi:hypothetical protein